MHLESLKHDLRTIAPQSAQWTELSGGRTNRVWRVQDSATDFVCKLYCGADNNPMFANNPRAEYACLTHLNGLKIAPEPVRFLTVPRGQVLIYRYIDADLWTQDCPSVARILHRVHTLAPPPRLPTSPIGSKAILDHASAILSMLPAAEAARIHPLRPEPVVVPPVAPAFVHGDVVPANVLNTQDGVVLIDWQCPALGDPASDLACFLSPAMQTVYGTRPLTADQQTAFLASYPDPETTARYRQLQPAYHFRMAAYCLWRVAQGNQDYQPAFKAEQSALLAQL